VSFNNDHDRVQRLQSASHAWIALHRLVEAYARGAGVPFSAVFEALERRFDFSRTDERRRPDLGTMRRAATWLRTEREALLATRRGLDAAQRATKSAGERQRVSPALAGDLARVRANAAQFPRVGCWGWRRRRVRAAGDP